MSDIVITSCGTCARNNISPPGNGCSTPEHHNDWVDLGAVQKSRTGIPGMGTDAPMQVLEGGGKQAQSLYRFDLVDAKSMFEMSKVLSTGAEKYGVDNWRKIPVEHHINHAIAHLYAYLAGDNTDDHLTNALCRAMFARAVTLED